MIALCHSVNAHEMWSDLKCSHKIDLMSSSEVLLKVSLTDHLQPSDAYKHN